MPGYGGMNPYPRKFGGGRSRQRVIIDALNADRGTAYLATERQTSVNAVNMALARGIAAAWATNQRLANAWTPTRMSEDILARWEEILALAPAPEDTGPVRRARVTAAFQRFALAALSGQIAAALQAEIGGAFVAVEYIGLANATIYVPDGSYPWGVVGPTPWSSNVSHVLVKLQKPTGWTEGDFYEAAAKVALVLEPMLPIWTTFAWYRPGPVSTPITGGPSAAGFYLDDASNLDNEIFDV